MQDEGALPAGFGHASILGLEITRDYPFGICFALKHDDRAVEELPDDEPWLEMSSCLGEKARNLYRAVRRLFDSWGCGHSRITSNMPPDDLPVLPQPPPPGTSLAF